MSSADGPKLRETTGKDCPDYLAIQAITYNDGAPWKDEGPLKGRRTFIYEDGDVGIGAYAGFEFDTLVRGAPRPTIGFSMVSILPEMRRSGHGKSMMAQAAQLHAAEGVALGGLYAFSEEYYRQIGFECSGYLHEIDCPTSALPKGDAILEPRRLEPGQHELLKPVYEEFASRRSGFCRRTDVLWARKFMSDCRHVFAFGDPIEAYVIAELKSAFFQPLDVPEFVWLTERGRQSALAFLRKLAINKTSVRWSEPNDGPFISNSLHTGSATAIKLGMKVMYRIFSLEAALAGLPMDESTEGETAAIRVVDPVVSSNNQAWLLSSDGAELSVRPTDKSDLTLPIGILTQLMLGQPSVSELVANGILPEMNRAVTFLGSMFPGRRVGCLDFY